MASAGGAGAASAVDQMIEYAFSQRKVNANMAVDVLLSGLSYADPRSDPLAPARLHLALAHIEAERNAWAKVSSHASSGLGALTATAATASAPTPAADELIISAAGTGARALLIQGLDEEAQGLAEQAERALRTRSSAAASTSSATSHTRSLGLLALTANAAGGPAAAAASASSLRAVLGPHAGLAAALQGQPALADAVHALGVLAAARGADAEAEAAFAAAAEGAVAARSGAAAGGSGLEAEAAQQHSYEVEADALAGRAQLQMRAKEWGQAEELLGAALKAAEAAAGDRSPALAPLLTLLGYTYSRSARVTFAEGLFREAAKLLRLDPGRQQPPVGGPAAREAAAAAGVHASAGAVLAWRYAQLLWVLPNRAGEAAKWEAFARQYWDGSGRLGGADIAGVLGGEAHLKGEGADGSGVVLSTRFRRAWHAFPAPAAGAGAATSTSAANSAAGTSTAAVEETLPLALQAVASGLCKAVLAGRPPPSYPRQTEEWYWSQASAWRCRLWIRSSSTSTSSSSSSSGTSGCSSTAPAACGDQPPPPPLPQSGGCLIDPPEINLSQTPREQCELEARVADGLHLPAPGQEGRGAPAAAPSAGRVAVRLRGGREVAVRPENVRSPHAAAAPVGGPATAGNGRAPPPASAAAGAGFTASSSSGSSGNGGSGTRQQKQRPPPNAELAELIRADLRRGATPPLLTRETVLRCGLPPHQVRCVRCGTTDAAEFMALRRTAPLSPQPCPEAVRLECLDCSAREAERQGVAPTARDVEDWVDERVMGSVAACSVLMGHPQAQWGGGRHEGRQRRHVLMIWL
ncbi:hypothetical protein HXX76_015877 [Chlamydomonas incerta]|uniref:Uncharacterized protein n=1 Tax=Chlamydomonas incerta TaxID=51695 RepID=A0A835VRA4_CHLIN|nr:hypothetical protein HXX76_015877 [Chlamydomonas incerta]|eukprot:KAG2422639.1 hypothetical protein HXX76_015877 [Chlamydomonas incerta]